ncbi:MAG: hypothetical protein J6T35_03500 [Bacteroidales bacterium]|nr:hypothetical protein [Bacteroidales bacterium]
MMSIELSNSRKMYAAPGCSLVLLNQPFPLCVSGTIEVYQEETFQW